MLETFTVETFAGRIEEVFRLRAADAEPIELRLAEVTPGSHIEPGQRAPFSIVFIGPREPLLPQSIYSLEHEALGAFELFLVPIGRDDAGTSYEAVFA